MTPSPKPPKELVEETRYFIECNQEAEDRADLSKNARMAMHFARALLDSLQRLAEAEKDVSEHERDLKNMAKDHLDSEFEYRATIRDLEQRLAAAEARVKTLEDEIQAIPALDPLYELSCAVHSFMYRMISVYPGRSREDVEREAWIALQDAYAKYGVPQRAVHEDMKPGELFDQVFGAKL